MFDRFSEEAKQAMVLARKAAETNGTGYLEDVFELASQLRDLIVPVEKRK